ncbi:unnamed protein product [Brassicogethes aeneus]|uniref:Uncharacterized protein n=1 Tax=Brassicogethes aeneus TaxID=1431903 RepID=A0A9P0B370_BRAAE|nr:unnamed protein product [Brassicogethes aeneus]
MRVGDGGQTEYFTLVGAWKCCLPWCSAPEGKSVPPAYSPPAPPLESPPRTRQPSPHLLDILEEESEYLIEEEDQATLQPLGGILTYKKRRNVQSPSPTLSVKTSSTRKGQRTRSVTSTTSSETSSAASSAPVPPKMQAEQGSIGDLQNLSACENLSL